MTATTLPRVRSAVWTRALGIVLAAVLTALSARLRVILPFSPVPLTLQVLVVVGSGLALGPAGGLIAQLLYLQAILMGAPLAASGLGGPAAFVTPTAGYLVAFPAAAWLAGLVAGRNLRRSLPVNLLAGLGGLVVIYLGGMLWLSPYVGGLAMAWKLGVVPFLPADLLKVTLAGAALSLRR